MKRFYREAAVIAERDGYSVALDDRPVRSPGKAALVAPTRALAEFLAAEWNAQQDDVIPDSMPMTRFANSAIDRVRPHRDQVVEQIAGYVETDLLCYRADRPEALAERQEQAWQPLLDWVAARYGAALRVTRDARPIAQEEAAVAAVRVVVAGYEDFALSALHALTSASGSVVLALAVAEGRISPEEASAASLVDESFQAEEWGEDPAAVARWVAIGAEIHAAARFLAAADE